MNKKVLLLCSLSVLALIGCNGVSGSEGKVARVDNETVYTEDLDLAIKTSNEGRAGIEKLTNELLSRAAMVSKALKDYPELGDRWNAYSKNMEDRLLTLVYQRFYAMECLRFTDAELRPYFEAHKADFADSTGNVEYLDVRGTVAEHYLLEHEAERFKAEGGDTVGFLYKYRREIVDATTRSVKDNYPTSIEKIVPPNPEGYYEAHKEARRASAKASYKAHKAERLAKVREYAAGHKAEIAQKNKAYLEAHKEDIYSKNARYREEHREELRQYAADYREANREKCAAWQREYYARPEVAERERAKRRERYAALDEQGRREVRAMGQFAEMRRQERLSADADFYADFRAKCRIRGALQRLAKNPGKRPYRPLVKMRIPDGYCKGEFDKALVGSPYIYENLGENERRSAKAFGMGVAIRRKTGENAEGFI